MNKGFQLCPKCKGSGLRNEPIVTGHYFLDAALSIGAIGFPYKGTDGIIKWHKPDNTCPVCKGKLIINIETGHPPIEND